MERYRTFSVGQLQFIDSLQFLNSSLDKLSGNLRLGDIQITKSHSDGKDLELLRRKGFSPYEYINSFNCFNESQLPSKEAFFSKLTRECVSDKDYQHAQNVWKTFDIQSLGQYHDLYLQTDVLLLADVFETLRRTAQIHYKLDPANYFSLPGMTFDALLKKSNVKLELLTDINMHLFVEMGLRGGISTVSRRHAKANNEQCPDYDPEKPKTWIQYLDANNLRVDYE